MGAQIIIRGEFGLNKYKEKVIKIYKMRVIEDVNEEFYFYLEIIRARLHTGKNQSLLGRDEGVEGKGSGVEDLQANVIVRKLTSVIMEYLFEHADKS